MRPNIGVLDTAFPLFGTARLRVVARGWGVPVGEMGSFLTIDVTNVAREPVEVAGVHAGFRYTNPLAEAVAGKKAPMLPLRELDGGSPPPRVLGVGETVAWTAGLDQLERPLDEGGSRLAPHLRYLDANDIDLARWARRSRLAVAVRNAVARWTHRRLAVVVTDGQGSLYKTKVRWQPPDESAPQAGTRARLTPT